LVLPFISQWELILLAVIVVLIFGSSQVPRIARNLGRNVREITDTLEGVDPRTPLRELERPAEPPPASGEHRPERTQ
jgi:TatA/E family protein of Tat protein translocase